MMQSNQTELIVAEMKIMAGEISEEDRQSLLGDSVKFELFVKRIGQLIQPGEVLPQRIVTKTWKPLFINDIDKVAREVANALLIVGKKTA